MTQKGFAHILVFLILVAGIGIGTYYILQTRQELPSPSALPGKDYKSSPSATPYQTTIPLPKLDENCQFTSCHGLDISCGSDGPKACTASYALGDRCRQFAKCQVVDGECQIVKDEKFAICKACVENCVKRNPKNGIKQFDCESKC